MKHVIRVFSICIVLVGGTAFFAYQLLNQFNIALDDLSASSFAIATQPIPHAVTTTGQVPTSTPEIVPVAATSTEMATSTESNLSFVSPKQGSALYFGCTYQLSFQSSTTIHSLVTVLVDASTTEAIEPTASGLAQESRMESDAQNLYWKVGVAWPGEYYVKASNVNGADVKEYTSDAFTIRMMPKGKTAAERENICKESNGSLLL
ncbi:MAG: hypothetical protein V1745_05030 [Patescibacteria group bacterium]